MTSDLPVVLVPACNRQLGHHPFHIAGKKYVDFVRLAGCLPLVVPNAQAEEVATLLALADGVLLTGSPSNVHPSHFDEGLHNPDLPLDVERDRWTLPFIPQVLARGIPLLAICRGTQETNVALGGSLHQAVQEVPGYADHRAAPDGSAEVQYGPAHEVEVMPGGVLPRILDRTRFRGELGARPGREPAGAGFACRGPSSGRAHRGVFHPPGSGLQSVCAVASRMAGEQQSGVGAIGAGLRPGLPGLSPAISRTAALVRARRQTTGSSAAPHQQPPRRKTAQVSHG